MAVIRVDVEFYAQTPDSGIAGVRVKSPPDPATGNVPHDFTLTPDIKEFLLWPQTLEE